MFSSAAGIWNFLDLHHLSLGPCLKSCLFTIKEEIPCIFFVPSIPPTHTSTHPHPPTNPHLFTFLSLLSIPAFLHCGRFFTTIWKLADHFGTALMTLASHDAVNNRNLQKPATAKSCFSSAKIYKTRTLRSWYENSILIQKYLHVSLNYKNIF